ncbi:MAG: DUF4157 domain-containing protein [Leptolyngbya sp. SIO1E4]|nr:DUF4157 domain-containing protein [Leptolyngbya sp. SIO1E4]
MVLQPKLTIGESGDAYEQEADRVAKQVVRQMHQPNSQSRSSAGKTGVSDKGIQRKADAQGTHLGEQPGMKPLQMRPHLQLQPSGKGRKASPELETSINRAKREGQPLPKGLQQSMGQAIGADFSNVTVHTGNKSDTLNRSLSSRAFTTGGHVFFKRGEYNPSSQKGQELLAHELTHVVQQTGVSNTSASQTVVQRNGNENDSDKEDETKQEEKKYKRIVPLHEDAYASKHKRLMFKKREKLFPARFKAKNGSVLDGLGFNPDDYPHLTKNHIDNYEQEVMENPKSGVSLSRTVMEGPVSKGYKFDSSESDSIYSIHTCPGNHIITLTPRGNNIPAPSDFREVQEILGNTGVGKMFGEHDVIHSATHYPGTPPGGIHKHYISRKTIKPKVIDDVITALVKKELIGERKKSLGKTWRPKINKLKLPDNSADESANEVALKVRKAFNTPGYREEMEYRRHLEYMRQKTRNDPYGGLTTSVPEN